ncbi:MAG: CHASE3 domain-containing protein [Gammaproteobacteria bacterium]
MARRFAAGRAGIAVLAIVVLALMGWITHSQVNTLSDTAEWVSHTERVRFSLEHTLSVLKDAQTGMRGYVFLHDEASLDPYREALPALERSQQNLSSLVRDNPKQAQAAVDLSRLSQHVVDQMRDMLAVAREGTPDPQWLREATGELRARMGAVRTQVAQMQGVESALLAERLQIAARARVTAEWATALLALLGMALVVLAVVVNHRGGARLRRSEQWLSTTLSSIGDGVIATDSQGNLRFLNSVAESLTGWPMNEAQGLPLDSVFRIVNEDTGAVVESPVKQVLRSGLVVGLANHTLLIRRDGVSTPIVDSGAPIKDEQNKIHGVVLVFRDDTQPRAAEAALRAHVAEREGALRTLEQTEQRLRLATEGAELGTWDLDLLTDRVVWNSQMYRIMGIDPATELTREARRSRAVQEDMPLLDQALETARRERTGFQFEYRISRVPDASLRWVSVRGRYFYDDQGKAVRIVGVSQDVTERRQLEDRVRQTQKLDALGTLAGGIAHDFNNILAMMRGSLLVAEAEIPPGHSAAPALAEIIRSWSRARDLVRQILTFGRQQEQDRKLIALDAVVGDALKLLRSTLSAAIDIQFRPAQSLPTVMADASQIHQIVMNLGINASQAIGREQGLISVDLDVLPIDAPTALSTAELAPGKYVRLRFGDNGVGMPADVQAKIFEPFFTTKAIGVGTGLGLSVVRGVMKNHDGAITVYSEPGKGTQFNLYFPAIYGVAEPVSESVAPARGGGQRILYLDDEPSLVELGKVLLTRLGYTVAGFTDARAALEAFNAAPDAFDLVLTDLSMPGTSGLEVAAEMLARRPDLPVLLASGYIRGEDAEEARRIGICETVWKPFTPNEIGNVISRVLAGTSK